MSSPRRRCPRRRCDGPTSTSPAWARGTDGFAHVGRSPFRIGSILSFGLLSACRCCRSCGRSSRWLLACRSCAPPASSLTPRSAWAPRPSAGSPGHNHLEAGRDRALDLHGLGRLAKAAIGQPLERLRDFRHGGVVRAAGDDEAPLFGPRPRRPGNGRRDLGRLESGRTPRHAPASRRSLREGVRCAV